MRQSWMNRLRTAPEVRREMAALIADAVAERDDERRRALLVLADHWADILRRRGGAATCPLAG
jgi:hypothetical protein